MGKTTQDTQAQLESKASKLIDKACITLLFDQPFFSILVLRLRVYPAWWLPTAATDGTHLWFNPQFVTSLTYDEVVGLLCHEVMHCASKHHLRMLNRDPQKWNVACDYIINGTVLGMGLTLPKGGLIDDKYSDPGMFEEKLYELLPDPQDQSDQSGQDGNGDGDGNDGGGAGSKDTSDPGGCGAVLSPRNKDGSQRKLSQADRNTMARDWEIAVVQAAKIAKAVGKCPGAIERMLDELLDPQPTFLQVLKQYVDTAIRKDDYSWVPPARRHIANDLYLPSISGEGIGEVVIAVDTSGSMSKEDLSLAGGAIRAVLNDARPERIHVVYADADVPEDAAIVIESGDTMPDLRPVGGGGTSFRPPFEWVTENGIQPCVLIYVTDMYCEDFPEAPTYPVIWAATKDAMKQDPPFGVVIDI